MSFVQLDVHVDQAGQLQDFYDFMAEHFPGWTPAAGNLETVLAEGLAALAAQTLDLAVDVPDEIFMQFGKTIVNLPPLEAAQATADSTWTTIDDAGYTIPAGTQVAIPDAAGQNYAFETTEDVAIPAGVTSTGGGAVHLVSILEGADANALPGQPELIDGLDFVDTISLVSPPVGGSDAEDPVDYRDRLARELQLLAPRPILPDDFAILVRDNVSGVGRAVAIDGYDPSDPGAYDPNDPGTWKERMVAVAVVDADGVAVASGVKSAADTYLQDKREVNFVVNIIDPDYTEIDVTYQAKAYPTFDTVALRDAVNQALTDYLDPANWGLPTTGDDPGEWLNVDKVRYLEVAEVINRTDGVDYIESLTIGIHAGAMGTADLDLTGVAPLTQPGTITGTVD